MWLELPGRQYPVYPGKSFPTGADDLVGALYSFANAFPGALTPGSEDNPYIKAGARGFRMARSP